MVNLDIERILCNQKVLGTRICWGYQKQQGYCLLGPVASQARRVFLTSALSRPQVLIALTLVSLYRHPVFVYAGSPCLECLLTSLLTKSFLIQETFIEPALGPGSGETKMSEARSLLCQELSALIGAMCKQIFPHRIVSATLRDAQAAHRGVSLVPSSGTQCFLLGAVSSVLCALSSEWFVLCMSSSPASSLKAWKQRQPVIHSWISPSPCHSVFHILGLFIPSCVPERIWSKVAHKDTSSTVWYDIKQLKNLGLK